MGYIDDLEKIDEDAEKLRQLTGFSLNTLIELFAAGYTLKAPDKPLNLYEMERNDRITRSVNATMNKRCSETPIFRFGIDTGGDYSGID